MLARRIVGITGISLWALVIVIVVGAKLQGIVGGEQMFENLPEGWKVEKSFVVPMEQRAVISQRLGGRISKLTNTVLSIEGKQLQVNILYCPTEEEAEKIHKSILEMKDDPAFCLMVGDTVVEFVGDDAGLAKEATYELGIKARPGGEKQKESSEGQLEDMAKDFVNLLVEGKFEEAVANFDSTMRKALPTGKLQEVWNSLVAQAGPFVEQVGVRKEKILQYEAVFVTCRFERQVLDAKVVYDKERRIAGLFFIPSKAATE